MLAVVTALVAGVADPSPALARLNTWTSRGPEGAVVASLAIDPTDSRTVYAGTRAGVFKSTGSP